MISVIIPCYNQSRFLEDALRSISIQRFKNWECIIIDDGSIDKTRKIAESWCKRDSRFLYFFQNNSGLASARNLGLEKASGDYIQFLDADDCLDERKFDLSINLSERHMFNLIISNFRTFKNDFKNSSDAFCELTEEQLTYKKILFEWDEIFNIPIHCGFFTRELIGETKFQENLKAKEDWIFWLIIFQKNYVKPAFINKPLAYYRMHDKNMSRRMDFMEEHTIKARKYLAHVVPPEDCREYYGKVIEKRDLKIKQLENHMKNYRKTRTYRLSTFLKKILNR